MFAIKLWTAWRIFLFGFTLHILAALIVLGLHVYAAKYFYNINPIIIHQGTILLSYTIWFTLILCHFNTLSFHFLKDKLGFNHALNHNILLSAAGGFSCAKLQLAVSKEPMEAGTSTSFWQDHHAFLGFASMLDEIIFRGFFYPLLRQKMSVTWAIVSMAAMHCLLQMSVTNLNLLAKLFEIAVIVVACLLVEQKQNILCAIVLRVAYALVFSSGLFNR